MSLQTRFLYSSSRYLACRIPQKFLAPLLTPYYKIAIFVVVKSLSRQSGVLAVYLAGSSAAGKVRYGVSDIDFFILITGGEFEESIRQNIKNRFMLLRKFFPQLQQAQELAIFSMAQIDNHVRPYLPHMLSIPGRLKLLWEREITKLSLAYKRDHEMPLLSAMWRKFLLAKKEEAKSWHYAEHIRLRIKETLEEVEQRLGIQSTKSDLLTRLQQAVKAVHSSTGVLSQTCVESKQFHIWYSEEFLNFNFANSKSAPQMLKCIIAPLELIDYHSSFDFCFDEGALFPVHPNLYPFILTEHSSPSVYDQIFSAGLLKRA